MLAFGAPDRWAMQARRSTLTRRSPRKLASQCRSTPALTLLANEHGRDKARLLFPKRITPASKVNTERLKIAMALAIGPDLSKRADAIEFIRRLSAECPKDYKGLMVDTIIQSRTILLWLDMGIVHPTAKSRLDAVVKFVRRLHVAELAADGSSPGNVMSNLLSLSVAQYRTTKNIKYSPMVSAAAAQVKRGKRVLAPLFRPCNLLSRR